MSEVWHLTRKQSWWDGSVITWCGQRWKSGTYTEAWFGLSRPDCPACKTAKKHAKK
ncbi:hypothetical protein [Saccharopolyspora cebuensis]|uniref:Zinc-ribbon domain-containing protein n=1 Tax=Saccharopolyspora cebuensis TaxID=418759 RepID=A0ABV4CJ26_9PSEU